MTVKEIATLWGTSQETVRRYCTKGYILGAYKNSNNIWVIPDNYKQPYISRKKKFSSQSEKLNYVLLAIESKKFLDYRLLALNETEFTEYADQLVASGYAEKNQNTYSLTVLGIDRCDNIREKRSKEIKDNIKTAVDIVETGMKIFT